MMPRVGCISPVRSRKRVVLPVPLRPTTPHRSPDATVNVTPEKSVVAPKSTPTFEKDSWVTGSGMRGGRRSGNGPRTLAERRPSSLIHDYSIHRYDRGG